MKICTICFLSMEKFSLLRWRKMSGRSRGFGFVQFDSEESGRIAIEELDGCEINGKEIYVAKHKRREVRLKEKDENFTNVYVNNFGSELNDKGLRAIFEEYGEITSCKVMTDDQENSKGFGFVNFVTTESAKKAVQKLNNAKLLCSDGKTVALFVGRAQSKSEREALLKHKTKKEGVNLYIKNLHESVNDARLLKMFSDFGTITSAKVMMDDKGKSKCFGFVCLSSLEEAAEAIAEMHGAKIASKKLYVSFAQPKEERKAQLRNAYAQRKVGRRPPLIKAKPARMNQAGRTCAPLIPPQFIVRPNLNYLLPTPPRAGTNYFFRGQDLRGYSTQQMPPPTGLQKFSTSKPTKPTKYQQKATASAGKKNSGTERKRREPVESSYSSVDDRKPGK